MARVRGFPWSWSLLFRAIVENAFDGCVGQEFIPRGDKVDALTQAVELCDV